MFKKGEYILYGTVGVCQVEGISKPDFSNNDKVYYSLVPKFDQDTTIYIPVDSPKVKMRESSMQTTRKDPRRTGRSLSPAIVLNWHL